MKKGKSKVLVKLKHPQDELKRCQKRFSDIAENVLVWIWEVDANGKYTYSSPVVEQILGYKPQEVLKMHFYDLFHPEDREKLKKMAFKVFAQRKSFREFINRNLKKNGKTIWLSTSAVPIMDKKGNFFGYRGADADVTGMKQAEGNIQASFDKLHRVFDEMVQAMSGMIESRDPYTAGHQRRGADLASAIAKEMHLSEHQIGGIRLAGIVHDIGKIYVPLEILNKPGRLTTDEFEIIKTHPQRGYDILKTIEFPWPVAIMVLQHHERLNGSGYPLGLSGEDILLESKVLGVADVVEAMLSQRPYRAALSLDEVLAEISKNKEVLYDSRAVEACLKLFTRKGFKINGGERLKGKKQRGKSQEILIN